MKNPTRRLLPAILFLVTGLMMQCSLLALPSGIRLPAFSSNNHTVKGTPDQQLLVNLVVVQPGNIESLADGFRIRYNYGYSPTTSDDILKMTNFAENLSSYRENKDLIVERRPLIQYHDTIFMRLTNTTQRNYRLKLYTLNFSPGSTIAWVEDAWLKTNKLVGLNGDTASLDFSVTAEPASAAPDRFRVIFYSQPPLAVNFTQIAAVCNKELAQVKWTVNNEMDLKEYTIERSADGNHFSAAGVVLPALNNGGATSYTWQDNQPFNGTVYYRVCSRGRGNETKYSSTVKLTAGAPDAGISVFPNPVTNYTLNIQLTGITKGNCRLLLYSLNGQLVYSTQFTHTGGTGIQSIRLDNKLAEGNYQLTLISPDDRPLGMRLCIAR